MSTDSVSAENAPKNAANTSFLKGSGELSARVAICLTLLFLFGGAILYWFQMPRIITALFLSAGVTLLVYHFLGGIPLDSEFHLGALRLGGSMAVLIGVAWWLSSNPDLDPQYRFHIVSPEAIVGSWDWKAVGADTGLDGSLTFEKNQSFSGQEFRWEAGPNGQVNHVPFLDLTNGKWSLSADRTTLSIESDVVDHVYNRRFHWRTEEPLVLVAAFGGQLWPYKQDDPNLNSQPWGVLITKNTSLSH